MNHKLTQVGTNLYVKADEVVRLSWEEPREELDYAKLNEPGPTPKKLRPGRTVIVTRPPNSGFLSGNSDSWERSDWPFDRVRQALGLTDVTPIKEFWEKS